MPNEQRTVRVENVCPHCEARTDAATRVGGGNPKPKAGQLSICAYCGEASRFTEAGLEKIPDLDFVALPNETLKLIFRAQQLIRNSPLFGKRGKPVP